MKSLRVPTFGDVRSARDRVARFLPATPFFSYPALDRLLGFTAFVKHENHQPVGAFKVRGGVNLLAQLSSGERRRGVAGASTGNHGQSIAYAARMFGVGATIVVPEGANPGKVAGIQALGARVVRKGERYDDARRYVEAWSQRSGVRYIHSGNEPELIAGVATYALEMVEAVPDLDAILVPVGGGSGAAGCCIVAKRRGVEVIGVQSAQAPAAFEAWASGGSREIPSRTEAEGLATSVPFELPQRILRGGLSDFVLVKDGELRAAIRIYLEKVRTLAEHAGAASLAGGIKLRRKLRGKKVGLVLSGGNLSLDQLRGVLDA